MLPWRSRRTIVVADLQRLRERVSVLEREVARLMIRQEAAEVAAARIAADAEAVGLETEAARIEAPIKAERIEAEVRAMATLLEATTPHYPRV
jgi:hypothetical protein